MAITITCATVILAFSGWIALYQGQNRQKADTMLEVGAFFSQETGSWGLGGYDDRESQPTGSLTKEKMADLGAYYVGDEGEKVLYLTFDCGYENGNTAPILEALKKHRAPATFFVVGHFLETAPELVKRMVLEGHHVGNHTYHHLDLTKLENPQVFAEELEKVEQLFSQITGEKLTRYYRPPQGKYSERNMMEAKKRGYTTVFWSLAYVDWKVDEQPTEQEAMDKMTKRIHPGAIVLLHNTSSTNAKVLDQLLEKWTDMGYRFGKLEELIKL